MAGAIEAIVSAPLNKEAMRLAGHAYEGQTEILGELTGATRYGMILLLGTLRVMMLTTHMALRKACDAVTREKVLEMIELADQTLRTFGISKPRIGVAGLNPHAGEGGLFGSEEVNGSPPAVQDARKKGIAAVGPVPADVVFVKAKEGEYDLVLAMYHDQANMAAKLLGFGDVTTVLAGLPIIRTSVGHGTAFDIAGKNVAKEGNFIRAITAAAEFAVMKRGGNEMGHRRGPRRRSRSSSAGTRGCATSGGWPQDPGGNLSVRVPGTDDGARHRERRRPARRRAGQHRGGRRPRTGHRGAGGAQAVQGDRAFTSRCSARGPR